MILDKDHISERILVTELSKGNEKAFRKLFDAYRPHIHTYSLGLLKSAPNAKEIVQDVFLKVWLNREMLNPDLSFKSYVFTIARNTSFNFLQKAANDRKLREEVFYKSQRWHDPIETSIKEEEFEQIRNMAIEELPPKRKRIFKMSREEEKSYEEISLELGISISTVKNQMSKSLTTLRTYLLANGHTYLLLSFMLYAISFMR